MSVKVKTSPVKSLTRVPQRAETDASGFVALLEAGKIDEASRVISRMLDFNKAESVHTILQDFLKGGNFDESLEMLTLIANLSRKHQVKLLKLFICSNFESDSKEPYEKKVRRLIDDIGFIERMKITSLEIYLSLAHRIVSLSGSEQNGNSEILNLFGSYIYPALLECEISEQVPYLDWLNLALLSDYCHEVSPTSQVTLTQFAAQVQQWSVIEQAFNMVEPQKSLVYSSLLNAVSESAVNSPQTSLLDLWIIFRANLRLWSCERASLYLASFLCGFASLWKILSNIFPKITCVPLASRDFTSELNQEDLARLQQVEDSMSISSPGNHDHDLNFLYEDVYLSSKATSLIKSSLVQSESRSHILQCLVFLSDFREFLEEDLYSFKMSVKMAISVLSQMRLLQTEVLESFCGLLANFNSSSIDIPHKDIQRDQIGRCASSIIKSFEPDSKRNAIRNLLSEIKQKQSNIEIIGIPFAIFGTSCLVNDSIDVINYTFTLLTEFLLNQSLKLRFDHSSHDSSNLGFTFVLMQFCWPSFYGLYCKFLQNLKQCKSEKPILILFGKTISNVLFINEMVRSITGLVNDDVVEISVTETDFVDSLNDQTSSKRALSKIESEEYLMNCLAKTCNDDATVLNSQLFKFVLENVDQYLMLN